MSNSLSVLCLSIALLVSSTLTLETPCPPPPSIECKDNGCQIFNFQGLWDERGNCTGAEAAWPKSEAELLHAVAHAVKNKLKIRVVSTVHSMGKLACVGSQGLIISTQNYASIIAINKTAMTITVQAGAMMREVIEEAAKEGLAVPAMIYWTGVSAAGVISTGSHGSGLRDKGSGVYEYVVRMRLIVPAPPSEGYAKIITLTEAEPELKAARLSLGTLGAISEITFALQPMFKRSLSAAVKDDSNLENEAERFLRASDFADINWIPSHRKAVFLTNQRVSVDVPGDGLNTNMNIGSPVKVIDIETSATQYDTIQAEENVDAICLVQEQQTIGIAAYGSGFLNDGKRFTHYPVVGFNNRMQTFGGCQGPEPTDQADAKTCTGAEILDKNATVCQWDRRTHHTFLFSMELRVPMSRLHEAIQDVKKIRDLNPRKLCDASGIYMRTIKKSEAYLGPAEDEVTFEMISYRPSEAGTPKWNEDLYEEIEQMVIEKYGGGLHLGKSGGYMFGGLARRAASLKQFLQVKERFDPDGMFSNEWTDGVFGIGGRGMEEVREGCALDKACKCREDKHCAPHKGFFCQPGSVWEKARVCRKMEGVCSVVGSQCAGFEEPSVLCSRSHDIKEVE